MSDIDISSFLNRLGYMLLAEVDSLHEVEDQLWLLHAMLTRLMPIVVEGERKQSEEQLMEHRGKIMEVITLVHQVEDVTDSYLNTVKQGNRTNSVTDDDKARQFRSQIKGTMESLNELHAWFHRFTVSKSSGTSSSSSPIEEVVVMKDEVKRMTDLLLNKDENQDDRREVIPVVGPGGIGKTTFVRQVYDDPTIVEHFPCRLWINVGSYYKVEELLLDIMKQIIKPTTTTTTTTAEATAADDNNGDEEIIMRKETKKKKKQVNDLAIEIYKHLKSTTSTTRYLFVFDDVCEAQLWADINLVFPANNRGGSRIIFTTRYDEVALHARPSRPPFYLRRLSKEESWDLFSTKRVNSLVDSKSNSDSQSQLNTCLQELVDACCGVPLAIVALAAEDHRRRLMSATATGNESKSWWSDKILPLGICELIYNTLPRHLKMCLAYCHVLEEEGGVGGGGGGGYHSFYGKGFTLLDYKGLIVAEGLVTPSVMLQSAAAIEEVEEDIAEEYLNELINMNIIKVQSRSFDGRIKKIVISPAYYSLSGRCRHNGSKSDEVRSLFPPATREDSEDLERVFQDFVSLRVVVLDITINSYPLTNKLIHLRYLHLKFWSTLDENPRDFTTCLGDLWNLQFLKIEFGNYYLMSYGPLRLQIWKMRQLKLLSLRGATVDPSFSFIEEKQVFQFHGSNLQTLEGLDTRYLGAVDVLYMMQNLVTLRLHGKIYGFHDRLNHVFPLLELLRKLRLHCFNPEDAQCGLAIFPPNITHLTLRGTCVRMPYLMLALHKLQNLRVLKLRYGAGLKGYYVLDFGDGFPQLRFLKFTKMGTMKEWKMSVGAMPSLQKVAVVRCKELEGLPSAALEAITTLKELEVRGCKDGVERDARRIEERVGKDRLKLSMFTRTNDPILN